MRHVRKTVTWALALVTSLLLLAFLTGHAWHAGDESALAADSQPAIAISGNGVGPQEIVCLPVNDLDCDGFSATLELHVGTLPGVACGVGAWPVDINDDGSVDAIGDISKVTANFGKSIFTGAPVRQDIGPEPVGDGSIDI